VHCEHMILIVRQSSPLGLRKDRWNERNTTI
jgi:hypothetical protein